MKTIIKNVGHRWVKKDISNLRQKNGIFAPKGDNLELFQFLKSSGAKPNNFFGLFFVPYHKVTTNSVINKICNEKIKV